MKKRWRVFIPEKKIDQSLFPELHEVANVLLAKRGITQPEEAKAFLRPDWESGIHDPFLFSGMCAAVSRVFAALEAGERITVHGDYDADGVAGSTVVIMALREIEKKCSVLSTQYSVVTGTGNCGLSTENSFIDSYIPHRDKEGYGLSEATVELLKERGTQLLIMVDCGIANVKEVAAARASGMDVVILDHHRFGEELPDGHCIHPGLPDEKYPFKYLAAVGVSWKFACALLHAAREHGISIPVGWEKWLLDLVAIATVTDMVPLLGENRVLLKYGLIVLNKTRRAGLRHLARVAGCEIEKADSTSIGFALGPRINAAGRMEHAELALRLLLAESDEEAAMLAGTVDEHNRARQKSVEKMMMDAQVFLAESEGCNVLVLWKETWKPALVGLVAGKMLERTGKPCVAFGKHGETWVGSGRSSDSYNITEAMQRAGEGILTRIGGHAQACGFSFLRDDAVEELAERLRRDAQERLQPDDLLPTLDIDAEIALDDVDWRLVETVRAFEPFGVGNQRPLFLTKNLEVVERSLVGSASKHIRCALRSPSGKVQRFIAFNFGDRLEEMSLGSRISVVYDVGVNEWNGRKEIQCKLADFAQN
ncbi:single-stranded-DNA-specific exonuclease RecJ [Patescibacteria group bacterium]|nr:single-stranded-DNA-specific exonuclease RecJ [Patescibacteria group bacterium]MBU1034637.1 single-stranded-DNA-specific exonuclease RecJ [Patescibacteria group bacterium]MBU1629489.1 single-stranded-DNA-specific exonuclease RecJ [Patescibacteria group bacterium]MBU1908253.1 single-stranded-DNA-specific exonuclease RecJ [Patescibacteria group bacterium]